MNGWVVLMLQCVYSFSGRTPGGAQTIAIPVFLNESARPGVELDLTQAVIQAIDDDGRLRVLSDTNQADILLRGILKGYTWEPYTYDEQGTILSYRVVLEVSIEVINRKDTTANFSVNLQPWGRYDAETEDEKVHGIPRAAQDLARQILEKIFASF